MPAGECTANRASAGRSAAAHEIVDLTLDVQLEGAFDAVYVEGDNAPASPTDTMKNTVYALARQDPIAHVEAFAAGWRIISWPSRPCARALSASSIGGSGCSAAAVRIRTRSCSRAASNGRPS